MAASRLPVWKWNPLSGAAATSFLRRAAAGKDAAATVNALWALARRGDAGARRALEAALARRVRNLPQDHAAAIRLELGDVDGAESLLRREVEWLRRHHGLGSLAASGKQQSERECRGPSGCGSRSHGELLTKATPSYGSRKRPPTP